MGNWTIGQILVAVIIIAACVAVVLVVLPQLGIVIPGWAVSIFWICVIAFVAVIAIRFLLNLWRSS